MQEWFENHHAAPRPAEACNLWTQVLHANRIQALTARPETDNARRLAPIGVAVGMTEKHARCAGLVQGLTIPAVERRRHHHHGHTGLTGQGADGGDEFEVCAAMGLEIDDQQAGPVGGSIGEDIGQRPPAIGSAAETLNAGGAMGEQHPRQQMR
jgi:hypothetical protein